MQVLTFSKTPKLPAPPVEQQQDRADPRRAKSVPKSHASKEKKRKRDNGKKLELGREEWAARQKKRKSGPRVFRRIASGQVGSGSGQAEVIDLRTPSPSRSPSIDIYDTDQAGPASKNYSLSPDTTCPSRHTTVGPSDRPICDNVIHSLHHLTASLAFTSLGREDQVASSRTQPTEHQMSRQTSEEAIISLHHISATVPSTPTRPNSDHNISKPSKSRRRRSRKTSRGGSAVSDTSAISESSIISLHHFKASQSSVSPNTKLNYGTYESPAKMTPTRRRPMIPYTPTSDIRQNHEDTLKSLMPPPSPSPPVTLESSVTGVTPSLVAADRTTDVPTPSLESMQVPVSTAPTHSTNRAFTDQQAAEPSTQPTSPSALHASLSATNDKPSTLTRLGPSWKTETAPPSEVADEDIDELDSEDGDISMGSPIFDVDNPFDERSISSSPSPFIHESRDGPLGHLAQMEVDMDAGSEATARAPAQITDFERWSMHHTQSDSDTHPSATKSNDIAAPSDHVVSVEEVEVDDESDTTWATTNDISSKQWGEDPSQVERTNHPDEIDSNNNFADDEDNGTESTDPGTSSEESDDSDIDDTCGYRVFAGFSDLESINPAQWDDSPNHRITSSQSSRQSSFRSLSPRRPTALEATTGDVYSYSGNGSQTRSLTRVSADLITSTTPLRIDNIVNTTPHHSCTDEHHQSPPDSRSSAGPSGTSKRDQVILALLKAGHVDLAQDILQNGMEGSGTTIAA